ncbi:carbohydrate ABC transporter permease [Vallitalea okinawensis]|uniref:carbohydrate ABC transporter permease n=1 Tax=Vallitalea okinawensis TaxID=2078660 RepID=UPI000CFB5C45|nr:sugar ABC transporter permease [Vallitalea okinawensis]
MRVKSVNKQKASNYFWGYVMSAPSIIGLMILNIIPFFYTIYLSFTESDGLSAPTFVGVENFTRLASDSEVWLSVMNTLYYTVLSVPLGVFLSLLFAVFLNNKIKGVSIYRTIYFLPMVVAPAAIAMVWKWILNSQYGILNFLLSKLGIDNIGWLINSKMIIPSLAMVTIWSTLGYNLILILAGLKNIPETYYEAADIDGANGVRKFFHITIPLVSPMLFFVLITSLMAALKQFDYYYIMLDPSNPAIDKTQTILYLFYEYAFTINEKGYASAIVLLAFVIIMVFTALQFWMQKKWVHYE